MQPWIVKYLWCSVCYSAQCCFFVLLRYNTIIVFINIFNQFFFGSLLLSFSHFVVFSDFFSVLALVNTNNPDSAFPPVSNF